MSESKRLSAREFHAVDGVSDWRVLLDYACTVFHTGSFPVGLELTSAIGQIAEQVEHHPEVDLRAATVAVRLTTHTLLGLSDTDAVLARRISEAARRLGVRADPVASQTVEIAIDAMVGPAVQPFWRAVLGYDTLDIGWASREWPEGGPAENPLRHGLGSCPAVWFQQMGEPRSQRNRVHLDITVAHDVAPERVAAALAAGGTLVSDAGAPSFWVLADAEGNEACVCTSPV